MSDQMLIDNLNAEKIALDQSLVQQIQINLDLRKQHLFKDKMIEDLNKQIQELLKEKEYLSTERDSLKSQMVSLASEAQAIGG